MHTDRSITGLQDNEAKVSTLYMIW